jgi:hypothetical protein
MTIVTAATTPDKIVKDLSIFATTDIQKMVLKMDLSPSSISSTPMNNTSFQISFHLKILGCYYHSMITRI